MVDPNNYIIIDIMDINWMVSRNWVFTIYNIINYSYYFFIKKIKSDEMNYKMDPFYDYDRNEYMNYLEDIYRSDIQKYDQNKDHINNEWPFSTGLTVFMVSSFIIIIIGYFI